MTNALLAKVGIAFLALSGAGALGWKIVFDQSKEKTINSYLLSRGRDLPISDQDWENIKDFYSKDESENPITGIPKSGITKEKIKAWCEQEATKPLKEHSKDKLHSIETWCSKARTLSEQITTLGKKKLDTDTTKDSNPDKTKWEENEKSYKVTGHGFKIKKKNNGGTNNWVDLPETEGTSELMKTWCKEHSEKHFKYQEEALFQTWQKWCSKDA
ncbi:hypothetical protein MHC_03260 [Mycoplasma haemocanis str. Illinois]|uniref:Uncharacterized protein n=1 Tax=Mycoplasma haemocanis (strain Illinois) TaxID=1111676 RepID=H6N790_MYCHN|nr:hypothetical protein [Mycoplasma haemocanis]AEW45512.1 hypothetical protein MHC_03260 [Mycoplasma haemocanis str. Illinois]